MGFKCRVQVGVGRVWGSCPPQNNRRRPVATEQTAISWPRSRKPPLVPLGGWLTPPQPGAALHQSLAHYTPRPQNSRQPAQRRTCRQAQTQAEGCCSQKRTAAY